jgi:hypothetical protein
MNDKAKLPLRACNVPRTESKDRSLQPMSELMLTAVATGDRSLRRVYQAHLPHFKRAHVVFKEANALLGTRCTADFGTRREHG